ncbi:MAG: hypothetical protein FD141_598 [Fusobacteria bacterium]|nr:MAG: hypothetical protein FD141_598 [Fusobacteriota bacterium]KAF0228736.1 MAG: hypothetical protein FD182_992 [Fusobacteriota bacterium]
MIDFGYKIPQIGQYIMYILGGLLILAGVIVAIVSIIKSRQTNKSKENYENKSQEVILNEIEGKPRRRRSGK